MPFLNNCVMNEKRKKVLFVMPLPPPWHGSGLMSHLIRNSAKINSVFICRYVNLSTSRHTKEIYKFSLLLTIKKGIRFLAAFVQTLWHLIFFRPCIAYLAITCHGIGFLKDMPFVMLCKLFRCKIIIHQHNRGMSECVSKIPYRWLLPFVYRKTQVVLLSDKLYEDVSSVVMRNQIKIIPNGIPDINFSAYPAPHNIATTFLFLSHLYRDKGISVLLNACRQLAVENMSFKLLIIGGETPDYSRDTLIAEIERVGISNYVTYLGALYGEDKENVWHQSDFFVFPTLKETFGLVLCEALQRGIPCIASDEGGISDIIIDGVNGYLFEKGNEEQLAVLMRRCIMEPTAAEKLRLAARASYVKKYSAHIFEEAVLNLIMSV